jgi:hypothetical protein
LNTETPANQVFSPQFSSGNSGVRDYPQSSRRNKKRLRALLIKI